MGSPSYLTPDVWNLIFFFLDDEYIQKLCQAGDSRMISLVERRTSAFFPDIEKTGLPWLNTLSRSLEVRLLSISAIRDIYVRRTTEITALEAIFWPRHLVSLSLFGYYSGVPFLVPQETELVPQIKLLDESMPNLRYCRVKGPHFYEGFWALPSRLLLFSGSTGRFTAQTPWPAGLTSLNLKSIDCPKLPLKTLPATLESLKIGSIGYTPGNSAGASFMEGCHFPNLAELEVGFCRQIDSDWLVRTLPRSLTFLSIRCRRPSISTRLWIPPNLRSLHTSYGFLPSEYRFLPRSLTRISTNHCSLDMPADQRWIVCGGQDYEVHDSFLYAPQRYNLPAAPKAQLGESDGGFLDIPPALQHLRLGSKLPKYTPDCLKQLSTHFIHGLTSLDMRNTNAEAFQLEHLPITLTALKAEALTLPKIKALAKLTQLANLGLWHGKLTTQIAKAIPRWIKSLTLFHVSLITKGHHFPTSEPNKYVHYTVHSPCVRPFSFLPAGLITLELIPDQNYIYWDYALPDILGLIPAERLENLILDYDDKLRNRSAHMSSFSIVYALDRFLSLRHLYWSAKLVKEVPERGSKGEKETVDVFASVPLPPLIEALRLPSALLPQFKAHMVSHPDLKFINDGYRHYAAYDHYRYHYRIYQPYIKEQAELPPVFDAGSPYSPPLRSFVRS